MIKKHGVVRKRYLVLTGLSLFLLLSSSLVVVALSTFQWYPLYDIKFDAFTGSNVSQVEAIKLVNEGSLDTTVLTNKLGVNSGADGVGIDDAELAVNTGADIHVVQLFLLEASGGGGCNIDDISLTNGEADDWVFSAEKYYTFEVDYSAVNITAVPSVSLALQLTDGTNNMTIQYHVDTDLYEILSGSDQIRVPRNNASGWVEYNPALLTMNITYPVYFTDMVRDVFVANASAFCDGVWSDLDDFTFSIYNRGGLIAYSSNAALGGSASFTDGGDWMEGCVEYYGIIQVNQTWRKLQSLQYQYSLKFYENSTGTFTPEDQFMQHGQNSDGGAEKYGGVADYHVRWKVWAWDDITSAYILLGYIDSYMIDGDEGTADEWISIKNLIYEGTTEITNSTWNAFIEEEPAAKFRLWLDIWFNRVNASSIMGFRTGPFYYGMDDAGYLLWSTWGPQIDNSTEALGFVELKDGNDLKTVSSAFDLMKIEFEFEMTGNGGSGEPYRVCVEDVAVADIKLADRGALLTGINTPSPNKPIVIDMAQGGLLAPLINAVRGLTDGIWKALSGTAELLWSGIGERFPWFTDFFESLTDFLVGSTGLFSMIFGYVIDLMQWGVGFVDYVAQPLSVITGTWNLLVTYTAIFFEADPVAVSQLLIMIVIFMPVMEALSRGDTSYALAVARQIFHTADWIMTKFMDIGGRVISWIMEALPL